MTTTSKGADRQSVEKLLVELVGIPSVNPSLDGGSGEAGLADAVAAQLTVIGVPPTRQAVQEGRGNVVARLEGAPGTPVVVFEAHMDTVVLSGDAQARALRRGTRIHGRGACDTKGAIVAMLEALRLLRGRQHATVLFAATIDEEYGCLGVKRLVRDDHGIDLAVVGEAPLPARLRRPRRTPSPIRLRRPTRPGLAVAPAAAARPMLRRAEAGRRTGETGVGWASGQAPTARPVGPVARSGPWRRTGGARPDRKRSQSGKGDEQCRQHGAWNSWPDRQSKSHHFCSP